MSQTKGLIKINRKMRCVCVMSDRVVWSITLYQGGRGKSGGGWGAGEMEAGWKIQLRSGFLLHTECFRKTFDNLPLSAY